MKAGLQIVRNLLNNFHENEINYCHWKSNEHVDAAIEGDTDLDVLFDDSQRELVKSELKKCGFRLYVAPWWRRYHNIEDYIGIDSISGKIVHVHTHFGLVLGEKSVKSYQLSWGNEILDGRIFDKEHQIYCSEPTMELLILIVRMSLKIKNKKRLKGWDNEEIKNYIRESNWLKQRVEYSDLLKVYSEKIGNFGFDVLQNIYNNEFDFDDFEKMRKIIKNIIKKDRRYGAFKAYFEQKSRKFMYYKSLVFRKLKLNELVEKRSLPINGVIVSFMGSDGAGKSTQTARVYKELNKKIDVVYIYMGSGDGYVSRQRRVVRIVLVLASKFFGNKRKVSTQIQRTEGSLGVKSLKGTVKSKIFTIVMAISVAKERNMKLKLALKAKKNGQVVICDRYPQKSTFGYNDGPRLNEFRNNSNFIVRKIAEYEHSIYAKSDIIFPDLVIKLLGNPQVLFERRPEMTLEEIIKKQNGIREISFSDKSEIVEIDATIKLDEITANVMALIGDKILSRT